MNSIVNKHCFFKTIFLHHPLLVFFKNKLGVFTYFWEGYLAVVAFTYNKIPDRQMEDKIFFFYSLNHPRDRSIEGLLASSWRELTWHGKHERGRIFSVISAGGMVKRKSCHMLRIVLYVYWFSRIDIFSNLRACMKKLIKAWILNFKFFLHIFLSLRKLGTPQETNVSNSFVFAQRCITWDHEECHIVIIFFIYMAPFCI